MLGGSVSFAFGMLVWFERLRLFEPALNLGTTFIPIGAIAVLATAVEALPLQDIDNLTIAAVAVLLGVWWL
jgi:dolichol kinase